MEEELNNFIKVWIIATTCLCYSYFISSTLPKGFLRLVSLLPVFYLFTILPLNLTSFHLGAPSAFFFVWLANFKLFLFSFNHGPLSPPLPNLFHFISLTYLPIKLKCPNPNSDPNHSTHFIQSCLLFFFKAFLLAVFFHFYAYKHLFHPYFLWGLYCLHLYLELELILAISAFPVRTLFGFDIEPQFNEPYLATSLQDFWGRRWNLMASSILRPTVYSPIRQLSMRFVSPEWAFLPAVVLTFGVSGLMHEAIYYYITRVRPTWEVTWFFVLHGVCMAVEVAVKKVVPVRWRLNRAVSGPLTLVFLAVTAVWLLFPQLKRNKIDDKVIGEYYYFVNLVKQKLMSLVNV